MESRYIPAELLCGHPDHRSLVDGLPHSSCGHMRNGVGICGPEGRLFVPATRLVEAPRMGATVPIRRYEENRPDDFDNRPGGFDGPTGAD